MGISEIFSNSYLQGLILQIPQVGFFIQLLVVNCRVKNFLIHGYSCAFVPILIVLQHKAFLMTLLPRCPRQYFMHPLLSNYISHFPEHGPCSSFVGFYTPFITGFGIVRPLRDPCLLSFLLIPHPSLHMEACHH